MIASYIIYIITYKIMEFCIPDRFTGSVKLKGLVLFGGEGAQHPNELRL